MSNILVTGGAGFIASNLADKYISLGHRVVIIDNLSTGFKKNINPNASFYEKDIRDKNIIEIFKKENIEILNHHAAQMDVRYSLKEPQYDADVNILGSLNLLECARLTGVKKIIYSSTGGAVYGEPAYLPADEKHPINPICHYGISKHTVEHYIYLYNFLYNLDYTVLRYPNVFGPRQNPHGEAGVNAIFIKLMLKGDIPTIFGNGEQLRDYLYVDDVVKANVLALSKGSKKIYNLGTGIGTSVNKIFEILKEILNFPHSPKYAPGRDGEIEKIYLNSNFIFEDLGWKSSVSYKNGLEKTIDYFKI
ncbi:NAD-dependent epimerase/dehydratase family protein [Candidatus Poribacteria bacterium]|nr:NAD-dependent epimerase/dehydratase family protein [Candidatus Poribacteria bacterium]